MYFYLSLVQKPPENGIKASNQISRCPRHIKVRNLENGSSFLDTLHLTAKEVRCINVGSDFSYL